MTAETSEITDSNRTLLEHILTDLHDVMQMLRDQGATQARHDQLLEEFRPLIDQFRSPGGLTYMAARRARKGMTSGG
jgi:hypothetical protein